MGKTRESADLVSDGNIFSNPATDRVGIRTTNPRFPLEVGPVGASGTTLHVNGSARITGILSIGQGTVSIDGNSDQINVGTGVNIHVTNGVTVGSNTLHSSGLSINNLNASGIVTATGGIVAGGNTLNSSGLSINNLNASGIVTATGGVVVGGNTLNSSGLSLNNLNVSNLNVSGVVTSVGGITLGIQSAGTNVTTGVVTALNFVGAGNSLSYNAGTKTVSISIAGGGGGATAAPTKFSEIYVGNDSGFNSAYYYSAIARTAGGSKGNTFFIVRAEGSSSPATTRFRVYPITVNRTTGVITSGTPVNAWTNSSASSLYSTTHFIGPEGTGAIFAGGNNAIPGTTNYTFSYFKFIVNANGTLSDTAQVNTGADHVTNGTYMTLPTAVNSGYITSVGYQQSTSRAHYRLSSTNGSTITVGNIVDLGSDTSTVYPVQTYAQPGVYQSGTQVIGFINYRTNSSNHFIKAFSASGLNADYAVSGFDSQMMGFQMASGDVILYCPGLGRVLRFTAHNSVIDITSTAMSNFSPITPSGNYIYPHFFIGTNQFVCSLNSNYPFAFNSPLLRVSLNSSTGFTINGITTPDALTSVGYQDVFTSLFPLYANANDAVPDKLLVFGSPGSSAGFKAKVISMPTFTTI